MEYISAMKLTNTILLLAIASAFSCSKSSDSGSDNTGGGVPVLSSAVVTKLEGNGGTTNMEFVFRLSKPASGQVSARVRTQDGFAKEVLDYKKVDQQIVFQAGETSKTVIVEIVADDLREGQDDFLLSITDPVGCTVATNAYKGTIQNDDTKIPVSDEGFSTPDSYPGMTLVWSDEFSGTAVNTSWWNFENGDGCPNLCGWGNNELEWYTQGDNVTVTEGKLVIEARQETRGTKNYTSTRMTTKGKKIFTFGRIDIRARVPYGKGIWPALWMLPEENKFGTWPRSGEMDIMELIGQEPNKVHATIHYGPGPGSIQISKSKTATNPFSDQFHVYSLIWEQDKLQFLVDNEVISTIDKTDLGNNTYPFNENFFFIFNIAVGGNWPGPPDASTYFPQWMMVDYVRVFQ
jgi:beta-glucanase (GH16 family)